MILNLKKTKTYCITLDENPLGSKIFSVLSELGYENINPRPGYIDRRAKPYGISMAVYNVIKDHLSNDTFEPFIIFEEDARPIRDIDTVEIPDNADALYLGLILGGNITNETISKTNISGVYSIIDPVGAHAIAFLSKEYALKVKVVASKIISGNFFTAHIDGGYCYLSKTNNLYAIDPIFCQDNPENEYISKLTMQSDLSIFCK